MTRAPGRLSTGVKITRRKDGRYCAHVTWTDADGRRRRKMIYGTSPTAVRQRHEDLRARLEQGRPLEDARTTLEQYAREWIATTLLGSDRARSTKDTYSSLIGHHIAGSALASTPLKDIRPMHVERWLVGLRSVGTPPRPLGASTRRQAHTVLGMILDTAVRDELISRNPSRVIRRPRVEHVEAAHLSAEEARRLLAAAAQSRYQPLFALLLLTGLRRGEALALRWDAVDLAARMLVVRGTLTRRDGDLLISPTKSAKSRRAIPLSDQTVVLLRELRKRQARERLAAGDAWDDTGFVFTTELGTPVDPRNALRALKAAAAHAHLPQTKLHTLRHSAATVMLMGGVPLKVVSEILGHSSIAITADVYGHVSPEVSRDALDRLSRALSS